MRCRNESLEQIIIQIYLLKGIAFLPTTASSLPSPSTSVQINPDDFEWRQVNIVHYNETTHKWRVVESGTIYEVPRIYLMFITEDRINFAERIKRAVQLRENSECYLRFEAILDGFGLEEIPQPSEQIRNRIRQLLARQCRKQSAEWIEFYQREYTIVYQKFHAVMYLEKFIEEQRKSSNSSSSKLGIQIQLPTRQERKLKNLLSQMHEHHRGRNEIMGKSKKFVAFYCNLINFNF